MTDVRIVDATGKTVLLTAPVTIGLTANVTQPTPEPVPPSLPTPVPPVPVTGASLEPKGWKPQFDTTFTKLGAYGALGPDGWYVEASKLLSAGGTRINPYLVGNEIQVTIPKGSPGGETAGVIWRTAKPTTAHFVRFRLTLPSPFFMYGNGSEPVGLKVWYPYAKLENGGNYVFVIGSDMRPRLATQQVDAIGGDQWFPNENDKSHPPWPLDVEQEVEILTLPDRLAFAVNRVPYGSFPLKGPMAPPEEWRYVVMFGGGSQATRGDSRVRLRGCYLSTP